jgi:hypothetical protein
MKTTAPAAPATIIRRWSGGLPWTSQATTPIATAPAKP